MKKVLITVLVIVGMVCYFSWCSRGNNGIIGVGENAALIEGSCITINWDATETEAEDVLKMWQKIKNKK